MKDIVIESKRAIEALDVTDRIPVLAGAAFLWLATPHTTAALVLCEADEEMLEDIERAAAALPRPLEPFHHARDGKPNAPAHLVSALAGTQLLLPVCDGRLGLGTWQRVVFLELDGPKRRRLLVSAIGGAATSE